MLVASAIALLSAWVLKYAVDDLTRGVTRTKLALYGGLLLGIACVGGGFRFLMRRIMIGASRHIEYDIRNDFFAKLEQFPPAYYQARRTGDLMSRATNDLNAVRMMIGPAVMYSANTIIVFFVAVLLMLRIDPWLTAITLIPLPFISISVKYFGGAIHRGFERVQAQLSDVSAVVQESLAGVRVVRAYRQEQAEIDRFAEANREYVRRNRQVIRMQGMFFPTIALLLGLAALLLLWLGSREVITGRITLGELVAFNAYLERLSWPMIAFGWVTNMLQRGMASWERMLEVLDAEVAITDRLQASGFRLQASGRASHDSGGHRISRPDVCVQRTACLGRDLGADRAWPDGGDCRPDRVGEVDARQPARAASRSGAWYGVDRRHRCSRVPAGHASQCHRLRSAGALSVLGHGRRERGLWREGGERPRLLRRAECGVPSAAPALGCKPRSDREWGWGPTSIRKRREG